MPHTVDVLVHGRGLSLAQLAEAATMTLERLDAIINGRWTPSPEERSRIAAALGVSVAEINWGHTMSPRNVRYHRYGLPEGGFDRDG
jgi:transcriptional regulator with XRE-family HTH domain